MYKSAAVLGMVLFSQVTLAGYKCTDNGGIQITVSEDRNFSAKGLLVDYRKSLPLTGNYTHTNDYFYKVSKYEMMTEQGAKVDLTISTKTYQPGGGCNRRNCNEKSFSTTVSKLNYEGQEIILNCI